jgi:glucose/arabinose dehydrogenase
MRFILSILFVSLFCGASFAQDVTIGNTTLTQRDVVTGIQVPWEILWGPDDHIWVTERRGQILRVEPESGNFNVVLDWRNEVESGGEPGMLGMVLHPDFENTPLVYVVYCYGSGFSVQERLVSFEWDGTSLSNQQILLDEIPGGGIHNGSRILITDDQKILMTVGDRGNADLSQNMNSINGKLLRLNLDGSIPDDNPDPNSYIYSFGHRNAQGLCFGPNGLLYSSEHGAQSSDEFNIIEENRNYGWPNVQGACNTASEINFCNAFDVKEPLLEWSPCIAVNDIIYYNHPAIPEFENSILMAVLGGLSGGAQGIIHIQMSEDGLEATEGEKYFTNFGRLRDICINPYNGALYIATNGPGYPGSGPNRIVEYRNLDYVVSNTNNPVALDRFIQISPNPMTETGQFQFSNNFLGANYQIIGFNGQLMEEGTVFSTEVSLDLKNYTAGTYYIRATNSLGTVTKTFVVQ